MISPVTCEWDYETFFQETPGCKTKQSHCVTNFSFSFESGSKLRFLPKKKMLLSEHLFGLTRDPAGNGTLLLKC